MAITIYSRTFKKELDIVQLESQFLSNCLLDYKDFRDFVAVDAECPICNVSGAHIVSDGYSTKTNKKVRQAHFSFRKPDGTDAHKVFCDHYKGNDKKIDSSGDGFIKLGASGSEVTKVIRELVCRGIEHHTFNQEDIRNMRQWFTELRQSGTFTVDYSPHLINLVRASFYSVKGEKVYTLDEERKSKPWFNINDEVYNSLRYKYPSLIIDVEDINNNIFLKLRSNTFTKKVHRLVQRDRGYNVYDRRLLHDKYQSTISLAISITSHHKLLLRKFGSATSVMLNNPLLAVSALLLFVSDWDNNIAYEKFLMLCKAGKSTIPDAGNVIGMNPFIHYDAWRLIHRLKDLMESMSDFSDLDEYFDKEKERLTALYKI
ncbi:hypothetical protein [Pectobacterium atrosepticum]|uniref:hypothetical protein n=1 Tax=Pectobacterium atrosepticum TaxID=29471 RepID=UPI001BFC8AF3|nr:hypothetical protein [Pectobacterium atrosepticum]QWC52485.1 hypothetical protein HLB43_17980 [Pectobacterium atrosepticum]